MELDENDLKRIITASMTAALAAVIPPPPPEEEAPATPGSDEVIRPSGIISYRQFYNEYLSVVFSRDLNRGDVNWCIKWYEHEEARIIVSDLWTLWERLRLDPVAGMAVWMRDWAYPLMYRLFDSNGTFAACTDEGHNPDGIAPLPVEH